MKILHTADWHLGDNFHGFDRIAEHSHFFDWLKETIEARKPDALLVSGDIFDNANPSALAEEQLYDFLSEAIALNPGMRVVLTAGNHDSGRRLQAPAQLLHNFGVEVRGMVEHNDKGTPQIDNLIIPIQAIDNPADQAVILAVPYLRPGDYEIKNTQSASIREFFQQVVKRAQKLYGRAVPLILMAHLYAAGAEVALNEHSERLVVGGEDCINVEGLDNGVAYVALGHIHKAQQVGGQERMVFYAGSPIPMSFAEKNYTHGVNMLTIGATGGIILDQLTYSPLRTLQSIPSEGAAPLQEVMKQIDALPNKGKQDASQWRYLEIQLMDSNVPPTLHADLLNALDEKAVRLCRLIRQTPPNKNTKDKSRTFSVEQLRNISPYDIAIEAYCAITGEEMDDETISRMKIAIQTAEKTEAPQP